MVHSTTNTVIGILLLEMCPHKKLLELLVIFGYHFVNLEFAYLILLASDSSQIWHEITNFEFHCIRDTALLNNYTTHLFSE